MAKDLKSIEEIHDTIKRRVFADDMVPHLIGLDNQIKELQELVLKCSDYGESNSALLVGPRGNGKSTAVSYVLKTLQEKRKLENLLQVKLNGLVQTDDKLALKEITCQLQLENSVGDKIFGSFAENLIFLLEALRTGNKDCRPILFILDEFDLFIFHKNQTLLYNLFDISQSAQNPVLVIGLTCRLDIVEHLEKRVKSRFSHRQIHFFNDFVFGDYIDIFRSIVAVPPKFSNKTTARIWNKNVEALCEDSNFRDILYENYCYNKSIRGLHALMTMPVSLLSRNYPFLVTGDFAEAKNDLIIDHKSVVLHGLSVLELCLLIAMKYLVETFDDGAFNFQMVFNEYQKFVRTRGHSLQSFDKTVVLKAFEHLLALELVKSVDGVAANTPKEYRPLSLLVEPYQITDVVRSYPECPTELTQWATSAVR
ncbi:origin recognition complex subunit 4-like [Dendronephthya gigantea]|uniref:origin recognition complex subunit 4-like n=1 Tax=Dendronephthya gigantea TaxID=151771 RepID=UPI00106C52E5|nr:origin recognition complex subunit 4-like [Dendronephthya gigantea]